MSVVATLGNYDGVHLGHQHLLAVARQAAVRRGLPLTAVFFHPHPSAVLQPAVDAGSSPRLSTPTRRAELLRLAGADRVVIEAFDQDYAQLQPEDFARRVLCQRLDAAAVVVGDDFRFGHQRSGNVDTLRQLGDAWGFAVEAVPRVVDAEGQPIASRRIRDALRAGDLALASRLLGRAYDLEGEVGQGDGRGHQLGFATANLHAIEQLLPAPGVYAVRVRCLDAPAVHDAPVYDAVANLGSRPTFHASASPQLEVHLLDFSGDLRGQRLRVAFLHRLRDEQRFADAAALQRQVSSDIAAARAALGAAPEGDCRWL